MMGMDWTMELSAWMSIILVVAGPLTGAVISGLFGWLIMRQGRLTHDTFNSKMDKLLKVTEEAAFARGQKDQKENPTQ